MKQHHFALDNPFSWPCPEINDIIFGLHYCGGMSVCPTAHVSFQPSDMPGILILPGASDSKVDLGPGCHPDLPQIYRLAMHPLWNSESKGNIYYFIQDLSEAGIRQSGEVEKRLRILHGSESQALDQGKRHP
jgi:hypothetical protein